MPETLNWVISPNTGNLKAECPELGGQVFAIEKRPTGVSVWFGHVGGRQCLGLKMSLNEAKALAETTAESLVRLRKTVGD